MITGRNRVSKILSFLIVFVLCISAFVVDGQELAAAGRPERMPKPESPLRERAYFIADALAVSSNDISDKLQAAHLRADIAGLICGYGERAKAVDLYRKGIGDIVAQLVADDGNLKKEGKRTRDDAFVFELAL